MPPVGASEGVDRLKTAVCCREDVYKRQPLTLADERIARAIRENNARLVIIDPVQALSLIHI